VYSHADLKKLNVGCDAVPAGVDVTMFEEADLRKVEQVKREAAEKKKKEKAEKEAAEKEKKEKAKAEKEAAEKEKKEKANADKAAKESARERVAKSKSTDALDDAPALGGALGLGFLGINNSSSSLASQGESTKEGEKKDEGGTQAAKGMSVKDLAAALMAELRGLEDRVEVLGEEEGAMVALKLGAALEAVRQEPFKSI
jgi:membrane protein involved in colicin uptake